MLLSGYVGIGHHYLGEHLWLDNVLFISVNHSRGTLAWEGEGAWVGTWGCNGLGGALGHAYREGT